jgi:membrane protease YdiL (CAAX protease family)
MKSNAKGIIGYILIAFGLAWIPLAIQWSLGLQSPGEDATFLDYVIFVLMTIPTSFAPAIGCLVVRKWITREGFADAGLRLHIRKEWRYYLFALLYPGLVVPIMILQAWIGGQQIELSALTLISLLQMVGISVVSTPVVWGEEFGWRGYLQIRLFAEKPLLAAAATGLIWAIWHYPMILMGYLFSGNLLGLVLYPINMVITSILYGWLRLRSGSVWTASLAHATGNTVINPLLESLLPTAEWTLVWAGYRLITLAGLCAWIVLTGQLKQQPQIAAAST